MARPGMTPQRAIDRASRCSHEAVTGAGMGPGGRRRMCSLPGRLHGGARVVRQPRHHPCCPGGDEADQPVSIKVSGLPPGDVVSLRLRTTDAGGVAWSSFAAFRASQAGVVDPATSAAVAGSYSGVSAMGLFWSIVPQGTPPGGDYF